MYKQLHYLWEGTFKSIFYSSFMVYGKFQVLIPDPINYSEDYDTESIIRYDNLLYRGNIKHLTLYVCNISIESTYMDQEATFPIIFTSKVPLGKDIKTTETYQFRVKFMSSNYMSGEYEVSQPYDKGTFTLIKTERNNFSLQKDEGCIVG